MAKKKEKLSLEELLEQALVKEDDRPYKVPENWVWTRLGNISQIIGGGTPSSSINEYYENGSIPWITPADLSGYKNIYISNGRRNITQLGLEKSSAKLMPKGTVLLSSRAPIGYVVIAGNELCTNQGFKSFLPSKAYIPKYLLFYLKSIKHILESYASGTTFLELSGSKAGIVEIPLAPISEQKRIVEVMDRLFEKLDAAKELVQNALDSFENRKAAILHKAFTGELTAKWREENGVSLEAWEKKCLGDIVTYSKEKYDPVIAENKTVYIGLEHIEKNGGIINKGTSDEVKSLKTIFRQGDILYGKLRPYLNKHDIVDFDGICSTDILVIRVKPNILNRYINYMLNVSNFIDYAVANSNGINLPRISEKEISKYKLKTPSIEEQKEIVSILDNLLENEQRAKELCDVIEKIDLMKKAILSRAFRGELGTNDPEEESAVELLKEVLKEKI